MASLRHRLFLVLLLPAAASLASTLAQAQSLSPDNPGQGQAILFPAAKLSRPKDLHNAGIIHLRNGETHLGLARLIQARLAAPASAVIRGHLDQTATHHAVDSRILSRIEDFAFALRWRNLVTATGATLFWIGLAAIPLSPSSRRRDPIRAAARATVLAGCVTLLLGVYLYATSPAADDSLTWNATTPVRAAPGEATPLLHSLPAFQMVKAKAAKGDWLYVEVEVDAKPAGWIRAREALPLVPHS